MGTPPPGVRRVLQHGAGPARHGAAVVEQPGEESEHRRGEVHHQIRQSGALRPGDLLGPEQHADLRQHDCKFPAPRTTNIRTCVTLERKPQMSFPGDPGLSISVLDSAGDVFCTDPVSLR